MLPLMLLADSSTTTTPGVSTTVIVLLAIIAIIPGCWAAFISSRTRRDMKRKNDLDAAEGEGRVGVQFAQTAFRNLEQEVEALRKERRQWSVEREKWAQERERFHADRLKLLTRIEALNFQVLKLRQSLQAAGIRVPEIPSMEDIDRAS